MDGTAEELGRKWGTERGKGPQEGIKQSSPANNDYFQYWLIYQLFLRLIGYSIKCQKSA